MILSDLSTWFAQNTFNALALHNTYVGHADGTFNSLFLPPVSKWVCKCSVQSVERSKFPSTYVNVSETSLDFISLPCVLIIWNPVKLLQSFHSKLIDIYWYIIGSFFHSSFLLEVKSANPWIGQNPLLYAQLPLLIHLFI